MKISSKIKYFFLDVVYPSNIYCICCGKPISPEMPYALCETCIRSISWNNEDSCIRCGKPLQFGYVRERCLDCLKQDHVFTQGFSCFLYKNEGREMIRDLKYREKPYLYKKLSEILYDRIEMEQLALDYLLPVPMYDGKKERRGYNQAELLAKGLSERLLIPMRTDLLIRLKDTVPLSEMDSAARTACLKDAFFVNKVLTDRRILLVDDIFTTGSTANACASALKEAGASHIYVLTAASGVNLNYGGSRNGFFDREDL